MPPSGCRDWNGRLATKRESRLLVASSLQALVSVLAAVACGELLLAAVGLVVMSASVNFWRAPERGWRRTADFVCASLAAAVFLWASLGSSLQGLFLALLTASVALFASATWLWSLGRAEWVYAHVAFHALSTVSTIVLYVGRRRAA